jgi:dsRNA-specific ribonuclease
VNSRKANGLFGAGEQPLPAGGGDHQRKLQCKGENRNSVPLKLTEGCLEKRLGHVFRDSSLLIQAFCHASYVNEHPESGLKNNERLEFLGDAVLDLAVSTLLMEIFPDSPEGELSKFRAMVVDEAGLYEVALGLGLGEYLLLGRGED